MKKIILISLSTLFIGNGLFAGDIWGDRFNADLKKLTENSIVKIDENKEKEVKNTVFQKNRLIEAIDKKNIPQLIVKNPKKIHIFVRKNYTHIGDDVVSLEPAQWKTVIVKQKQEWDF